MDNPDDVIKKRFEDAEKKMTWYRCLGCPEEFMMPLEGGYCRRCRAGKDRRNGKADRREKERRDIDD